LRATATVVAASAAGAGVGALVGLLSGIVELGVRALLAGLLYLALAIGAGVRRTPPLQLDRETDQQHLRLGPLRWAAVNGAQLGLGFTSRIGFWSWYLLPVGIMVAGNWRVGALAWGLYGAGRTVAAVAVAYASPSSERLLANSTALLGLRGRAASTTRAVTIAAGIGLAVLVAV
jgi:hypothetical protein